MYQPLGFDVLFIDFVSLTTTLVTFALVIGSLGVSMSGYYRGEIRELCAQRL